jgi:hypothetical protein
LVELSKYIVYNTLLQEKHEMKDYLLDIVKNTYGLGIVDLVKIVGADKETKIEALASDRSVIIHAETNTPVAEFEGTFGMPNLGKLNTILGIPEYKDNAKISLKKEDRAGVSTPSGLHFENAAGDFKNDYRFMTSTQVEETLKSVKFRGANWDVDFEPSEAAILRLKFQASANAEEETFTVKTDDNSNLVFYFGDVSSHAGNFVFEANIVGKIAREWAWPVAPVMGILNLVGMKKMQISNEGVMQITVNTGVSTYNYLLPAHTK